jgi:hypothetical protein
LAIDGGHEVCGAMYNKQVLVPLQALVPQVSLRILLCCLRIVSISRLCQRETKGRPI